MIEDFRPYPATREPDVNWLAPIPKHWELRRLKYLLRERDLRSTTGTEQLLKVSQYSGVSERRGTDEAGGPDTRAQSLVGYKRVDPGDLVVNIMLAWNGSLGVSLCAGIASPAYCVYRFRPGIEPRYYHYLLRSAVYKARIKSASTGVVESRLRLYSDDLGGLVALVPPLSEQVAIARYLDHVDRLIRHQIRAKLRLIALLEEQRRVVLHRAVTRGLTPTMRMKPSGVQWPQDVPEHWGIARLKALLAAPITDGPHTTPTFVSDGFPFLSVDGIQDGDLVFEGCRRVSPSAHAEYVRKTAPRRDDILLTKAASIGKVARVKVDFEFSVWSPLALIRIDRRRAHPGYVEHALKDVDSQAQIEALCTLNTQKNLSMDDVPRVYLPVPPMAEQTAIAAYAEAVTAQASEDIELVRYEIDLLREYQARLVVDVVTGTVDVREAAAELRDGALDTDDEEDPPLDQGATSDDLAVAEEHYEE